MSEQNEAVTVAAVASGIRFVSPSVTPQEVATVIAVLSAAGGAPQSAPRPESRWAGRARPGWRSSGLPRRD